MLSMWPTLEASAAKAPDPRAVRRTVAVLQADDTVFLGSSTGDAENLLAMQ